MISDLSKIVSSVYVPKYRLREGLEFLAEDVYYLTANPHLGAGKYVVRRPDKVDFGDLSLHESDDAVRWLTGHPWHIESPFAINKNPNAVAWCISHGKFIKYLSYNYSPEATAWLLQDTRRFELVAVGGLSSNPEDDMVRTLIDVDSQSGQLPVGARPPSWIDKKAFAKNPNQLAISYSLNDPDGLCVESLSAQTDQKVADELLENAEEKIFDGSESSKKWCENWLANPNASIAEFVMKNIEKIRGVVSWAPFVLAKNESRDIVDWLMEHPMDICRDEFSSNPMAVPFLRDNTWLISRVGLANNHSVDGVKLALEYFIAEGDDLTHNFRRNPFIFEDDPDWCGFVESVLDP